MSTDRETKLPELVKEAVAARHDFANTEKLELSDRLVGSMNNETQIDAEFSSVKSEFKMRIEKAALETQSLATKLRDGFEMRPTLARILFNTPSPGRKT